MSEFFSDPPIGIDLGTTFSCISVYSQGRADIIADENGDRLIPSMVFYEPTTGNVLIGKAAHHEEPKCFGNCLKDIKRIIGRKFDDEFIKRYVGKEDIQFKIVKGENEKAVFEVEISGQVVKKTPEEASAEILKYLKNMAETYLNKTISKVVISIPAYFSNAQRKATKKAAELAGLELLRFITEPSSAGSYYIKDKTENGNMLVFDWGGGTLDVSLIKIANKQLHVQSVYGDTLLGGRDIDSILFKYFHDCSVDNKSAIRRLLSQCVELKKRLSVSTNCSLIIDCYNKLGDLELALTRSKFENLISNILNRAINIVEYGLNDTGWKKSDVQYVVLVGGSTRIPKIRQMLKEYFSNIDCMTDLHPDEAVAAGASLQAWNLKQNNQSTESYKITEVTPLSLGLRGSNNLINVFIRRNSPLPVKGSITSQTISNNQERVTFQIFEGERKNCEYNNQLGAFTLTGLPLRRAGDVKFDVSFYLDDDGILSVTATESLTGQTKTLVVTMGEFRLSEKRIDFSIAESEKLKQADDFFEKFVKKKREMKRHCLHIQYDLKKINDAQDQKIAEDLCAQFLVDIESLDYIDIDKLDRTFKCFNEAILAILAKNIHL